jgi:hypothetical protein
MREDWIAEVGIDRDRRVFVTPANETFEHVYRAAMEVHWDAANRRLSHPAPRNWTPAQWYQQIVAAVADEYGVRLKLDDATRWTGVSEAVRHQIEALA